MLGELILENFGTWEIGKVASKENMYLSALVVISVYIYIIDLHVLEVYRSLCCEDEHVWNLSSTHPDIWHPDIWSSLQLSFRTTTFPDNLQSLTFGYYFNQCLDQVRFPDTLECLTLGEYFNQSLEEVKFPSNLKSLTFGHEFCQSIDQVELPENLQFLRFGFEFRRDLKPLNHLKELCCRELMVSCKLPNDQWPCNKTKTRRCQVANQWVGRRVGWCMSHVFIFVSNTNHGSGSGKQPSRAGPGNSTSRIMGE